MKSYAWTPIFIIIGLKMAVVEYFKLQYFLQSFELTDAPTQSTRGKIADGPSCV